MSKVITFSRTFPSYHPKAGQPTYFVEKIWRGMGLPDSTIVVPNLLDSYQWYCLNREEIQVKHHTIRAGHRWKEGDWFSPRVWGNDINPKTGKSGPYHSKQITFAPDIQIKKVWNINIQEVGQIPFGHITIDGQPPKDRIIDMLSGNDGLTRCDFSDWFMLSPEFRKKREFDGQIICWSESIEY